MDGLFKNSIRILLYPAIFVALLEALNLQKTGSRVQLIFVTLSWAMIVYGTFRYDLLNRSSFAGIDKGLLAVFIGWCVITTLRSLSIPIHNPTSFPRYLGGTLNTAAWMVPFFVFYGAYALVWRQAWKLALTFSIIFLLLSPGLFLYSRNLIYLSLLLPFLVINWHLVENKFRLPVIMAFLTACVYFVYNSERNMLVRFLYYPLAYYVFLFFYVVPNRITNIVKITVSMAVAAGVLYLLYNGTVSKYISDPEIKENIQSYEKGNFNTTTRSMVYEDFLLDFGKKGGWVLGRGVLGATYSEQFVTIQELTDTEENVFKFPPGYRTELEGGYLMYILKAGLLGVVLLSIISLRAIYLGLFRSRNLFVKAAALIVVEWLISMYPYGIPEYSCGYILFWMSIGACLSGNMRSLTSRDIKALLANSLPAPELKKQKPI